MLLILFTMLFNGGMIPNYLLIKNLHLVDNRLALILPGLISAYNVIIMKTFFLSIPDSLEESARIDGANDVSIFVRIILPLSKASLATIALFMAVGYWNDYFSSVLYINSGSRWALQSVLRFMLTNTQQALAQAGVSVVAVTNTTAGSIKAASIVVATVPILVVYPFVQKHFVKGVMIGGVKG
jgi:putative aldouronate transport system permease protein